MTTKIYVDTDSEITNIPAVEYGEIVIKFKKGKATQILRTEQFLTDKDVEKSLKK
ncbi:MAG: hypothetical protein ACK5MW_04890 [Enterococcus sp.]